MSMTLFIAWAALAAAMNTQPAPQPMERIVVVAVASRVEESLDATPATASVIGREELERTLSHDIREALRYEPGISVDNGPARFGLGNINIRGLDGNRVQMLYDGVRLPDGFKIGSFSNASRNPFDLELLSRIEILRGPGSALYGSDALAGVVSMTTLDPRDLIGKDRPVGGFADVGYASDDGSIHRTGAIAGRTGPVEIFVGATRSDGHERDNMGENDVVGTARTTPNPQDTMSQSQLVKLVMPAREGDQWRATWDHFERRVATDVLSLNPQSPKTVSLAGDDRNERRRTSVDGVMRALGPVDRLSLLLYDQRSTTTQDTVEVRANTTATCLSATGTITCKREARFTFDQKETGFTAIGQSATGIQQWVYGVEWSRIESEEMRDGRQTNLNTGSVSNTVGTDIFPTRDFPRSRTERIGAFAQDEIALGWGSLIPALRYDRFEMKPEPDDIYVNANPGKTPVALTDDAWSPKLGALIPVGSGMTLALQAATGFRAPPYSDVNVGVSNLPLGYSVIPNPDLKPEKSRGFEAGLRGHQDRLDWSVTAYRTDYDDLIVSRAPLVCPGDPHCVPTAPITFQSQNVTSARIEGIEARAESRFATGWAARFAASAARGDDLTRHVPLNSVDPAKVVAGVGYDHQDWVGGEFHLTYGAKKTRIDNSAGTLYPTPAYTVADLTGYLKLGKYVLVNAGIFNLADRKYWLWSDVRGVLNPGATIDRYTQPGRNYGVQVKATF
jgi:hemoglobin/transferrin/lactoferrin receptor protein